MKEVSENLVIGPARAINPEIRIAVKFPNWMESYQEAGYNPGAQKDLFDKIYTGTETRHQRHTDQHLPRYESYSIMRYMENLAPGRNGGGWFDPYQCYPMDCYLEQAYLTVLSRPREVMMFCWGSLYNNKLATPMGLQLARLDKLLSKVGACAPGSPATCRSTPRARTTSRTTSAWRAFPLRACRSSRRTRRPCS